MVATLMASAVTFKKCKLEKLAFILLNLVDLCLTIFAVSQGAHELNPMMRSMLNAPYQMYMAKLVLPVLLAWLLPGKFLIPSIALLTFVIGWDIKELTIFFL